MFLIERVFGVACYFIVLLFVFIAIYYKKVRVKDILIFYIFVLALFAYFYKPYETADLYRIGITVESFSAYDFSTFYQVHLIDSSTPVSYTLYWIVGKLGNVSLLPVISVTVTYSIIFYILYKSSKMFSIDNQSLATVLLFIMSTGSYMMTVSGIRTMMAISLMCLCFFRESVMKSFRVWHILLYLMAAFTHNLALILIVARCIAFIISARLNRKWKLLIVASILGCGIFLLFRFTWLFDEVFEKAYGYITGDTYSYIWEYIIGFIALVMEIMVLLTCRKKSDVHLRESWMFLLLCTVTACIFVGQFSIFHRLVTYIAPIVAIPLLIHVLSASQKRPLLIKTVFCLSFLMLVVTCARGELSSLKFFVLT